MGRYKLLVVTALTAFGLVWPQSVPTPAEGGVVPCTDVRGCPDLVVDGNRFNATNRTENFSTTNCQVVEGMVQAGTRRVMRFTFTTPNNGPGDLNVGAPSQHPDLFVFSSCHNHYHFRQYADYRLWTPSQFATWDQLRTQNPTMLAKDVLAAHPELTPVAGNKQGFCVIDIVNYTPLAPSHYGSCSNDQGISVGWADEYISSLDGQFIDVTNVVNGTYVLEAEVNAEHVFIETNYTNNRTSRSVTVQNRGGGGGGITLTATGYTVSGQRKVDLVWSGATGTDVDVYRGKVKIVTTPNDGAYTDSVASAGTYKYKVCLVGTLTCSNIATVVF